MVSNVHDVLSLAQGQEVALKRIIGLIGSKIKGATRNTLLRNIVCRRRARELDKHDAVPPRCYR